MKKILLFFLFVFCQQNIYAQIINKLSVELNIGRYAKEIGVFNSERYSNKFAYINGFNINFNQSAQWQYYLGVRKLNFDLNSPIGFVGESSKTEGLEFRLGVKFSRNNKKRVFLSYGLELFEEVSSVEGRYWIDDGPPFELELNHKKHYLGIAPNLTFNIKLAQRIMFFADTRYKIGHINFIQKENAQSQKVLYQEEKKWSNIFEALNSIGLRFNM